MFWLSMGTWSETNQRVTLRNGSPLQRIRSGNKSILPVKQPHYLVQRRGGWTRKYNAMWIQISCTGWLFLTIIPHLRSFVIDFYSTFVLYWPSESWFPLYLEALLVLFDRHLNSAMLASSLLLLASESPCLCIVLWKHMIYKIFPPTVNVYQNYLTLDLI